MATDILNATVATVKIGFLEFEGLKLGNGTFGIGVPQIAGMFPYFQHDPSQAAKKLKRLMGESFSTTKTKQENRREFILSISLLDFERVLRKLDKKTDAVAEQISEDLIGLSLNELFKDAFNIKPVISEKQDRQNYLKTKQLERARTKETIKLMEADIKAWSENGTRYAVTIDFWVHFYNTMDMGLFGKFAKTIREEQFDKHCLIRDGMGIEALRRISEIQYITMRHLNQHTHPWDALKKALAEKNYPVMDWREVE